MTGTASPAPEPLDVVVVGEALIDIVQSANGQKEYPGGSPANVSY
ncbi:carbohydrate kinase, partial [Brevundimonas sp. MYb27]